MIKIERVGKNDLSVKLFVDDVFVAVFPTEKRARLYLDGSRDINGQKINTVINAVKNDNVLKEKKTDVPLSGANQKKDQVLVKRRGRPRKQVGNDRSGIL